MPENIKFNKHYVPTRWTADPVSGKRKFADAFARRIFIVSDQKFHSVIVRQRHRINIVLRGAFKLMAHYSWTWCSPATDISLWCTLTSLEQLYCFNLCMTWSTCTGFLWVLCKVQAIQIKTIPPPIYQRFKKDLKRTTDTFQI